MSEGNFGLTEAVSIALGGMIGGGIYAVLGVVTQITGAATWLAFILAGIVAICAGYSYVGLNELVTAEDGSGGGSVTFVQSFTGNSDFAGIVGWTLLVGYIGSMAMYAFAFGEFAVALPLVPDSMAGLALRPVISVLAVAGFVGLNLLGARATGSAENVLVGAKVLVLLTFGVGGIVYVLFASPGPVNLGISEITTFSPIMAGAVSFVAFQGWQLLFYDQESLDNPLDQIPKAIYIAIPSAVFIYVIVAVATYNLAPEALQSHPHTALTEAARTIAGVIGYATAGGIVLSLSALFSTGSAINATLFSAGYFAKGMLSDDLLPDRVGDTSASGVPTRTLLLLGLVTMAFTAYGSLEAITSFASLSFIVVFGAMSVLAFTRRNADQINATPPVVGAAGSIGFFFLMLYHLYVEQRGTFFAVILIAAAVFLVELLYFERRIIEEEIPYITPGVEESAD
ncbi:APC family permease [Natrinema gelatinilyticum]|uniref:APC family permease n=1 Tax=Natrinema gelatinilyticum TaxID=2961571 RepID=UPI0020C51FEE|nr:APC family permease [Natrinema gelatinilyticum]